MGWKFWQRKEADAPEIITGEKKLPRPKDLHNEVGRHLVVVDGFPPDWVWQLKSADNDLTWLPALGVPPD